MVYGSGDDIFTGSIQYGPFRLGSIQDPVFACSYLCGVTPGCENWMVGGELDNKKCSLMTGSCHSRRSAAVISGNKQCSIGAERF